MNPVCKKCRGELVERGYSSKRDGEILFDCSVCGEKWQGRIVSGVISLYQVNTPKYERDRKMPRTIRTYRWQDERIRGLGKSHQEFFDDSVGGKDD